MKYTKIPATTFSTIQLNAGIIADSFTPEDGEVGNILGATTGGTNFTTSPSFKDFGEDIDNCPKNTKELKHLDTLDVKMSGTFVTITAGLAKRLVAAGDIDQNDASHIVPRADLTSADFAELWWIGDYSDTNTGASAGFIAIHLRNALSTGGFQLQSTDKDKGQFAYEFTGHFSLNDPDTVPYEIWIAGGGAETPNVSIDKHSVTIEKDDTVTLHATTIPAGATITWTSSATGKASVTSAGVVSGVSAGSAVITASITEDGVTYTDTCTVIVTGE